MFSYAQQTKARRLNAVRPCISHMRSRAMPNHSVKPTCLRHAAYLKR